MPSRSRAQKSRLLDLVPHREGKHSAKPADALLPILLVGVHYGFGIAMALIAMAGGFQLRTQVRVIEDLAVVGDPEESVLVGHRLGSRWRDR